jgi:hypothetical protein
MGTPKQPCLVDGRKLDGYYQYRELLGLALVRVDRCESLAQLKDLWDRFPVFHKQWQFVEKIKTKKESLNR